MKQFTLFATALILCLGMTSLASSATTYKNPSPTGSATTTVLNGAVFIPSSNVELAAVSNGTYWAAVSKHVTGGTSSYGLLNTSSLITITKDLAPEALVTPPTSATAL